MVRILLDKIINRLVDRYYEDNRVQLQEKFEEKIGKHIEKKIIRESNYLPYRMADEYISKSLENTVSTMINDRIIHFNDNIKNGINEGMIYLQVHKVMKQRVNDIVEHEYKEKINSIVNEIIDKIKNT
jgi:demethoxyubiquinone hydroxylase (CLK1/Coq7/Cat5 family)